MNPRPTDYDADALTTTPSRRLEEQVVCHASALTWRWLESGDVSLAIFITSVSGSNNFTIFTNRTFHLTFYDHQALEWRLMRPKGMEDLAAFSVREVKRAAAAEERDEYSSEGQ